MQYLSPYHDRQGRGGRIGSSRLRESLSNSEDFAGLEQNVDRYDLLLLVKRAGKAAGFTSRMIQLLDYYMAFTRDIDWQEGSRPIVYQSIYKTALDLGVSDRQIQKLERQLFEAGALTWQDSGNCKRYGQRCPRTGRIIYAFGVDFTALAYLKTELEAKLQEKQLYDAARMEAKRQISWHRAQIKAMIAEMHEMNYSGQGAFDTTLFERRYDGIAIRYTASMTLETLRTLLTRHKTLYEGILEELQNKNIKDKQQKSSCRTDSWIMHKQNTNQKPFNKLNTSRDNSHCFPEKRSGAVRDKNIPSQREEGAQKGSEHTENTILKTGLQHIKPKQALNAASSRFVGLLPMEQRELSWNDIVSAASTLRPALHISQESWGRACQTLTRYGAAICILLTDQAAQRNENPVRKPAAYFNTMITRAKNGELHLHKSIFGLLKREYEPEASNNNLVPDHKERS